jgi:hypothetical protein
MLDTEHRSARRRPEGEATGSWDAPGMVELAGVASLGAGAIHAVAAGVHGSTARAAAAFTAVAAFQLGWGARALARPGRTVVALGALGNTALAATWFVSSRSGLSFVDGLEEAHAIEWGDGIAAALAVLAAALAALGLLRPSRPVGPEQRVLSAVGSVAVVLLVLVGMTTAARPSHHADGGIPAADHHDETAAPPSDNPSPVASVSPVPYDPARPLDLGGVEGVTTEQQARAENLIANTLSHLPSYADPAAAEAAGYASIQDGGTGYEHYIHADYRNDGRVLDPDRPESLVYQVRDGQKELVAAMYMAEPGTTLDTTPDIGGPLTQWHIHDNLCFSQSGAVAGLTDASGGCAPPLVKFEPVPMIHVWIVPHPCGPFAALEGIAGGSIKPGEERLCDQAHGH